MVRIPQSLLGKWVAEGKGKGRKAEYLDREPALEAERVMARSRVGPAWGQAKVAPQVEWPVL